MVVRPRKRQLSVLRFGRTATYKESHGKEESDVRAKGKLHAPLYAIYSIFLTWERGELFEVRSKVGVVRGHNSRAGNNFRHN